MRKEKLEIGARRGRKPKPNPPGWVLGGGFGGGGG